MRPFLRGIDRMRCGTVLSVLLGAVVGLAGAETSDAEQVALRQSKTLDFKRAAASFAALRGALQRTDGRVDLLIKEADCLYSRGEEKRAQTLLEDYLKRKPQDPDCVHVLLFRALVPLEHHIDLNT